MTTEPNILDDHRDHDTLGSRISRAREASNLSAEEAARQIGVTQDTYNAWEADRNEPRANKLITLAGCLSVSPTWLLHGIGESPISETASEELQVLKIQLDRLQELHQQTGHAIKMLEQSIARLEAHEQ